MSATSEGGNAGGSRGASGDKYNYQEDHHSSASDEDGNAVEVIFDPGNPYRRKSSLVTSEVANPKLTKPKPKPSPSQCLVHQFLEGYNHDDDRVKSGEVYKEHHHGNQEGAIQVGAHERPEPERGARKSANAPATDLESDASTETGQVDQKSWKRALKRKSSGLDHPEYLNSRLLTKKQLTDMAWGVRELSRRLGSIKLKFRARSIFLLTKPYDRELVPKTRWLAKWLLSVERDVRYTVYVEENLEENKEFDAPGLLEELREEYREAGQPGSNAPAGGLENRLRFWHEKMCRTRPHTFDFIITLGGDGTVLYASWLFQRIVPPVLSFSLGSLGFLTKFDFNQYQDILTAAFRDGVSVSLRLRFEGTVMRSQKKGEEGEQVPHRSRDLIEEVIGEERDGEHTHKPDGTYEVLNDIVVDRGPNATMSYTEIFSDDEHLTSVLADGVCVATPTGSTAYNLAAGGSLCHPDNPVMLVTAICAHTLSFRPVVLPDTIVLRIGVPYDARTSSWASFDGRERVEILPGDYVTISASRFPFASVQPEGRRGAAAGAAAENWVKSISAKLGWNTRQRQKNEGYKAWDQGTS
ncbi:ATP-NAD kinase [Durotheca rogersii]|uniref:ATP-NAD kinase n=1 Tax=Durotheca rogersii TaxID=419775 RepID=UPI00221FF308|nr:ATP-NAD kinase [Durotheca rogersii]KAI5859502.1 ATP-NAD kinase [Durotheca rogersii]